MRVRDPVAACPDVLKRAERETKGPWEKYTSLCQVATIDREETIV